MVAGGSTSNVGFNTPIFSSGLPGTNMYGYADPGQLGYIFGTQMLITTEGKVYVAGDNIDGAAGDGTTSNVLVWKESTPPTTYGPIKAFAFGVKYSFAITEQLYIYRAGNNGAGQLGLNTATNPITTWTTDTARLMTVSGGSSHTLGIANGSGSGPIYAAGIGSNYALGVGTATVGDNSNQTDFVLSDSGAMNGGQTAKWVCAGRRQSYAIRSDDALVFVGNNSQGVAGDGGTADKTIWTVIASSNFGSKTPRAVYLTGKENTREGAMMITTDGKIYGTGNNDKGQLGVGDFVDKTTWTAATGDIASETVTRLALTDRATFALDSTGKVWSTGISQFTGQGSVSGTDLNTFTEITEPAEFYSKTIVNIVCMTRGVYAVDSEGTLWGTGELFGLGTSGTTANEFFRFIKVPIYDIVPKEFKYTPTLTLENPNLDYGATVEFKNPNNRAFINLDDKTSTLRLGFVDNENNAGQFKGISIRADGITDGIVVPAFNAYKNNDGAQVYDQTDYIWNSEYFDRLNNYDTTNGRFTAPSSGYYYFWASFELYGTSSSPAVYKFAQFYKNGSLYTPTNAYTPVQYPGGTNHGQFTLAHVIYLEASDYVTVQTYGTTRGMQSSFLGFKIGA